MGGVVVAFADQKANKTVYTSFFSKVVIDEKEIFKYDGISIVIASSYWKEISDRLCEIGVKEVFISSASNLSVEIEDGFLKRIGDYSFERNIFYVLCPYNIGDTILWTSAIKLFKKSQNIQRICVIVKKGLGDLISRFPSVDSVIESDFLRDRLNTFAYEERIWELKNYYWAHVRVDYDSRQILSQDGKVMGNGFELFPGVSLSCALGRGLWLDGKYENPSISFNMEIGTGNKVLIMPYAYCVDDIGNGVWEELIDRLAGFDVYTNCATGQKEIKGSKREERTIVDLAEGCKEYRAIISLRSGLCDLLAMIKVDNLIILYPDNNIKEMFDVRIIWGNTNVTNIVIGDNKQEDIVNTIIKCIE